MNSELDQLIELYESEKSNLENLIKECIKEWDFLLAHSHSKALREITKKLQTLYNFNDPLHETKSSLFSSKSFYEKLLVDEEGDYMKTYYRNNIIEIENQLHELNQIPKKKNTESQEFDDAVYMLIEGKIRGFKFHLKREINFYLSFTIKNQDNLTIALTPGHELQEQYLLAKSNSKALKSLGFIFNSETGCLEYIYNLQTFKNSIFIKTLISRIIFDVYYYKSFDNPAFIEYL